MAPVLAASFAVYSASADNTTLTKTGITVTTGDVLVAKAATWDTGNGMAAPATSGQTWQQIGIAAPGGFAGWAGLWVCTITGSPGTVDVSMAPGTGGSTRHSMVVERWTGAQLDATPATNGTVHGTGAGTTTLTTVSANSAISWALSEANSLDPATSTYASGATQDGLYDGHVGSNGVQYFATQTAASAGSQTIGITNASNVNWTTVGVEIRAGSGTVTGSASLSGSGTLAAAGTVIDLGASSSLSGTGTLTADGTVTKLGVAAVSGSGSLSAAGAVTTYGTATLAASGGLTASGLAAIHGSAALSAAGLLTITEAAPVPDVSAHLTPTGRISAHLVPTGRYSASLTRG